MHQLYEKYPIASVYLKYFFISIKNEVFKNLFNDTKMHQIAPFYHFTRGHALELP